MLSSLRIVLAGYLVRGPLGGLASYHLQYLAGLAALGHDVYFLEDSDDYPSCYDPVRNVTDADPTRGLDFARRTFERAGFGDRWAYHDAHTARWHGPCAGRALEICASADLVLDLGGVMPPRPWLMQADARALIDLDPVFTQIRHLSDPQARERARAHTAFFTVGENVGRPGCGIPDDGLPWRPTRQPIVLERWAATPPPAQGRFTTVMLWDSYPMREYAGRRYGLKSDSFGPYLDLPARLGPTLELAVGSASAPLELLRRAGWHVRDSREPTCDPWTYADYIRRSQAEFSVAKHGYVVTRSGWFSDRSAAYLASGRPVLVQQTGFDGWLGADRGVVGFASPEQAEAGFRAIRSDLAGHGRAAREIAEAYFDARHVLRDLIEAAMQPPAAGGR